MREQFARRIDNRFGLTGVVVSNRGPLELFVAASDETAASSFVTRTASSELRKVIVRSHD